MVRYKTGTKVGKRAPAWTRDRKGEKSPIKGLNTEKFTKKSLNSQQGMRRVRTNGPIVGRVQKMMAGLEKRFPTGKRR
jgi:hypothetical protein